MTTSRTRKDDDGHSDLQVLSHYRDRAPVDLAGLARDLGLNVVYDAELGRDTAGFIRRDARRGGRCGYLIAVNKRDNARRQRFTLAHEIGHFLLHRDLIGDGIVDDAMYRSPLGDHYERQANRFAADTLLPADLVRQEWRNGNKAIQTLAERFDVSADAMRIRLEELGLAP